jgi:salicylate hydroxylase
MGSLRKEREAESTPINLAIIGGGLAGLALTIGLLPYRQYITTTIYEAAGEFAEVGVGVAFGPNAVRAMGLISPAILKGFKKHATGNENAERENTWLSFRYGMESRNGNGKAYGDLISHLEGGDLGDMLEKEGISTRSCIHRARFLEELIALVPEGTARFKKKLEEVRELEQGGVRLKFTDGEEVVADAVVGCDGVKSVTRPLIVGSEVVPKFTGEVSSSQTSSPLFVHIFE